MASYRAINPDDPDELAYVLPFLDHLQAFNPEITTCHGFCVFAYPASNPMDYEKNFASVLVSFLTNLNCEELYLLTEIRVDWEEFGFENEHKKSLFLEYTKGRTKETGYLIKVKDLVQILPLFFHRHPDSPTISLMPGSGDVLIELFLCKDGNFHTLYDERDENILMKMAAEAGLLHGSYEICQVHSMGRV